MGRLKIYDSTDAAWKYVSKADKTLPDGDVVGTTDTQTLTNKTIDGDNNTLQDIPYSAIKESVWTSWTPTLTNLTLGNGTLTSVYMCIGKLVVFSIRYVQGSTSSMGTIPTITLPVAPASRYLNNGVVIGFGGIDDTGSSQYFAYLEYGSGSGSSAEWQIRTQYSGGTGYITMSSLSTTGPMTWATGDSFNIEGTYEAA